jgi:hypothetical protein
MERFKMIFNNHGALPPKNYGNLGANISAPPRQLPRPRPVALNAPMIDRVYKAKPGCSSCGKKVA